MIVCSCHGVTDREIRKTARQGACTPREIAQACGAGSACGGCRPTVRAILDDVHAEPRVELSFSLGGAPEAA